MSHFDTQTLVALVCVAVALAVLFRRALSLWKGKSAGGCGGGCHGCGEPAPKMKVSLPVLTEGEMKNEK